jgi:2-aminoadipate transaminase
VGGMEQTALFDFVLRKQDDLVSFALGLPDPELFPVAELAAVAASVFDGSPDVHQYTGPLDELRGHIARLMAMRGAACTPEQIVLTNGAQHGIDMAVRLLRRRTAAVIVDEITYSGALSALPTLDVPIRTIPAARAGGGMPDAVAGVLGGEEHVSFIYVMPEGHNPLGTSIPASDRSALAAPARERAFGIVEDDATASCSTATPPGRRCAHWITAGWCRRGRCPTNCGH